MIRKTKVFLIAVLCMSMLPDPFTVFASTTSVSPSASDIIVTNSVGTNDTVYVDGRYASDFIKVYNAPTGGKLLGYGTVAPGSTVATVSIPNLGAAEGSVYVSVTSSGMSESTRTEADYSAEPVSAPINVSNVTITNNVGQPDTIYVGGIAQGDTVKIYNAASGGKMLGSTTSGTNCTDATVSLSQLGSSAGSVFISITSKGMLESTRTQVNYLAEQQTDAPDSSNVVVKNNVGQPGTIYVSGLVPGEVIKEYNKTLGGSLLASATVGALNSDLTMTVPDLGARAGSVYLTGTIKNELESNRTEVDFSAKAVSNGINASNVTISNNVGTPSTINVSGADSGDVINIYNSAAGGALLGSATVAASMNSATISIANLATSGGSLYISVTSSNELSSQRTQVNYGAKAVSNAPSSISVVNNARSSGSVYVGGLNIGDKVNVYSAASGGTLLGSATASSTTLDATISTAQLSTAGGSVYVSVTSVAMLESPRVQATYSAQSISNPIDPSNITVSNNVSTSGTVNITGLNGGDVVKIYNAATGGTLLQSTTVATNMSSITINVNNLQNNGGSLYFSVTSNNEIESTRTQINYGSKPISKSPSNISVINNIRSADTVYVSGLSTGDVVKVYNAASGGTLLGSASASSTTLDATVSIPQLGTAAGSVYVSVTSVGISESPRVQATYSAEQQSAAPSLSNVAIYNYAGAPDLINVYGLNAGDVVKVYDSASGGNMIGTAAALVSSTQCTVTIPQLGTTAGSVYISVTSPNKNESVRQQVNYAAEVQSASLDVNNIVITNNAGEADTVNVSNLNAGDLVKVYDLAAAGKVLGYGTVADYSSSITISIPQLGNSAGNVYISVTSNDNSESNRVKASFGAEVKSTAPLASNVSIANNAGMSSTATINGLNDYDVVNVYDAAVGGNLLGTAMVSQYTTNAVVSISTLSNTGGSIFISVTSKGKQESARTEVDYAAKTVSTAPNSNNVTVQNNAGIPSTVNVVNLSAGDIVKVYDAAANGNLLGTATVAKTATNASITIQSFGISAGNVYVTVTSIGKLESNRTQVGYLAQAVSTAPDVNSITITNNAGLPDTIKVIGIPQTSVVNVYDSPTGGDLLGSATVASGSMESDISITQLGISGGSVYISVVTPGKLESSRTQANYDAESETDIPISGNIVIENNSGEADTIKVSALLGNDIVKVYNAAAGGNMIATATVAPDSTDVTLSVTQLGSAAGSVYISVTSIGKNESARTEADYVAESAAPLVGNISVVNNAVIADTVTVSGLSANDVVNVYDAEQGGNLLGTAVVGSSGTQATVTIPQLSQSAGKVYVSVTNFGRCESSRTAVNYIAEQTTNAPYIGNIAVANNTGAPDTVTVTGLSASDVVKIYDASTGGNLLGTAIASNQGSSVVITIPQLGVSAGQIYISNTNYGKYESSRTLVDYTAEA